MTILHALCRHYDRIAEQEDTPRPGFSSEKISYAIILSPEGTVLDVVSVQDTTGPTPKPRKMAVPAARKRASNIAPNLLWDKTAYVLGVTADNDRKKERLAQEHAAFRALHAEALKDTGDAGLAALAKFLDRWTSDQFEAPPFREEMRDTNVVFRLSAERRYLHDRPAANDLVERLSRDAADTEEEGLCLITARRGPVARLHPPVKGVRGAQSSGASIMSFNLDAFTSHGKIQGLNAPISTDASFKAHTALNRLLDKDSRQKITIGDTTVAFWADPPGRRGAERPGPPKTCSRPPCSQARKGPQLKSGTHSPPSPPASLFETDAQRSRPASRSTSWGSRPTRRASPSASTTRTPSAPSRRESPSTGRTSPSSPRRGSTPPRHGRSCSRPLCACPTERASPRPSRHFSPAHSPERSSQEDAIPKRFSPR